MSSAPAVPRNSMRLATFIDSNLEEIIGEWVVFARTCLPASDSMDLDELRDHAAQMLVAIAKDLGEAQTEHERSEKSMGRAPRVADSPDRPSETHAALRYGSGFTMMQMVSEYRALRASVLRLWINAKGTADETDLEDMTRFNEAIDQALAESTARFVEKWRESEALFVGILGHDLRNPLGVLRNSADLVASGEIDESTKDIMLRSAKRMEALIEDMIAFAQGQYGKGIPIQREPVD